MNNGNIHFDSFEMNNKGLKPPPSAYIRFCQAHRDEVKAKPGMTSTGKIYRELYRMWWGEAVLTGERNMWETIASRELAKYERLNRIPSTIPEE